MLLSLTAASDGGAVEQKLHAALQQRDTLQLDRGLDLRPGTTLLLHSKTTEATRAVVPKDGGECHSWDATLRYVTLLYGSIQFISISLFNFTECVSILTFDDKRKSLTLRSNIFYVIKIQ